MGQHRQVHKYDVSFSSFRLCDYTTQHLEYRYYYVRIFGTQVAATNGSHTHILYVYDTIHTLTGSHWINAWHIYTDRIRRNELQIITMGPLLTHARIGSMQNGTQSCTETKKNKYGERPKGEMIMSTLAMVTRSPPLSFSLSASFAPFSLTDVSFDCATG